MPCGGAAVTLDLEKLKACVRMRACVTTGYSAVLLPACHVHASRRADKSLTALMALVCSRVVKWQRQQLQLVGSLCARSSDCLQTHSLLSDKNTYHAASAALMAGCSAATPYVSSPATDSVRGRLC